MTVLDRKSVTALPDLSVRSQVKAKTEALVHVIKESRRMEVSSPWSAMLVESLSDAIIGKSLDGTILSWNPAAERLFGHSPGAAIGSPISLLFAGEDRDALSSLLVRVARGERIEYQETECLRQDGGRICVSLAVSPIVDKTGAVVGASTIARDISERKRAESRLQHLALHDALTGLPNRVLFSERVNQSLTQARRHGHPMAVLFIDLDCFKEINDSLGHRAGDWLLRVAAGRLRHCLREGDEIARLGGDEFLVSLSAPTCSKDTALIAGKILQALSEPFFTGRRVLRISGSIGIGLYPRDGQDVASLMHAADTAMYQAKKKGRGNFQFLHKHDTTTKSPGGVATMAADAACSPGRLHRIFYLY